MRKKREEIVISEQAETFLWKEKRAAEIISTIESKKAEMNGVSWAEAADLEDDIEALEDELGLCDPTNDYFARD